MSSFRTALNTAMKLSPFVSAPVLQAKPPSLGNDANYIAVEATGRAASPAHALHPSDWTPADVAEWLISKGWVVLICDPLSFLLLLLLIFLAGGGL